MPTPDKPAPPYCLHWDELHRDTRSLAHRLIESKQQWRGIIAIARGGLVPAAILARELDLRLVDTLCISSYAHDRQCKPEILKTVEGDGEGFLLVDDLVDSGVTARIARELLPRATLVAVYAKPQGKDAADLWQREFSQDTWIHFPWDIEYRYVDPIVKQCESNTQ
jgi:xanthine phosphoribosyltransferase